MAGKRHALLELRDAAYESAAPAHERMKNEISLYRNEDYTGESWIKRFKRSVTRSISPQINTAINRLIPIFTEQMAHVNVDPIRGDATELEQLATEELQEHLDSLEAVDAETEELRTLILHNQAMGNAISKIIYDPDSEMVRAVAINPLSVCTGAQYHALRLPGRRVRRAYDIPQLHDCRKELSGRTGREQTV